MHVAAFILFLLVTSGASASDTSAISILKKHCTRCHGPARAEGELNRIDDVDYLVAEGLVFPGDPELSSLWYAIHPEYGNMPPKGEKQLSKKERQIITDWIKNLKDPDATANLPALNRKRLLKKISQDSRAHPGRLYFTWFEELDSLRAKSDPSKLTAKSDGMFQMLNSLSWADKIFPPEFLTDDQAVAIFDPKSFTAFPDSKSRGKLWQEFLRECRSAPMLPAMDFACAMRKLNREPSAYYRWLGLPAYEDKILLELGIKNLANSRFFQVAAESNETFAPMPRLFARISIGEKGYYWRSHEVSAEPPGDNPFTKPFLWNVPDKFSELTYSWEFTETIFSLPNGLQAYIITDKAGKLLAQAPDQHSSGHSKPGLRSGFNCAGCHWSGAIDPAISRPDGSSEARFCVRCRESEWAMFGIKDEGSKMELRTLIKSIYPSTDHVTRITAGDEKLFNDALKKSQTHPNHAPNNGILTWLQGL